jgi:hypothetical protein
LTGDCGGKVKASTWFAPLLTNLVVLLQKHNTESLQWMNVQTTQELVNEQYYSSHEIVWLQLAILVVLEG